MLDNNFRFRVQVSSTGYGMFFLGLGPRFSGDRIFLFTDIKMQYVLQTHKLFRLDLKIAR